MIKVVKVKPRTGSKLEVEFSDGTRGVADLSRHVEREPFLPLASAKAFRDVRLEHGAVEWPSAEVGIASEALYAVVHGLPKPRTLEMAQKNERTMCLRELRMSSGATQVAVAAKTGWTQGALSMFERGEDHKLSTLKKYVAALGGELQLVAVMGDKRIQIRGVLERAASRARPERRKKHAPT